MIYLIDGTDEYCLREEKKSLMARFDPQNDRNDTVIFDGQARDFRLAEVIYECDGLPFFHASKLIIVNSPAFLSGKSTAEPGNGAAKKKGKKNAADDNTILGNYLKSPNPLAELIFYCDGFEADKRKKEYKLLAADTKNVSIRHCTMKDQASFEAYVEQHLRTNRISMNKEARDLFYQRIGRSTLQFHKALDKILLYGEKVLDRNDIDHLVEENPDYTIWQMVNSFLSSDVSRALFFARDMVRHHGYDYSSLISLTAVSLKNSFAFKRLYEYGLPEAQIAQRTGKSDRQVYASLKSVHPLSSRQILQCLNRLAELDQGIKAGKMDPENGFELFLMQGISSAERGYSSFEEKK